MIDAARYQRDGYLVVPGLLGADDVAALRAEAVAVSRGQRGALPGLVEGTVQESDSDAMRRYMVCVMPHKLPASLFARYLSDVRIVQVLQALIGPDVKAVHSQLYYKAAGMPGNAFHQDERFIPTRDRSLVTAWIALEDARIENGCLRVIPGSHRPSILWPMRKHNNPELDRAEELFGFPYQPTDAVPVEIAAGSVIFFDGYLIHGSFPNHTQGDTRRSLLYVYASAHTPVMFNPTHYQPTAEDYPDITMVCGTDPHVWVERGRCGEPFLRPAGPTVADLQLAQRMQAR